MRAMMWALAGDGHISFEGDLLRCVFPEHLGANDEETDALCRNTLVPRQDFVVLPLKPESVVPILDVVLPARRYIDAIIHIQIERDGELRFGSYDNFHRDCIGCRGIDPALLDRLESSGVIRSWRIAPDA
ncbi:MAG: hypothetical protein H6810_09015 [Phycisphaeraceae bacterium]|nr:MAG: hypothetical protein H6810_09015 [Phycisphaeraceae bacterium]